MACQDLAAPALDRIKGPRLTHGGITHWQVTQQDVSRRARSCRNAVTPIQLLGSFNYLKVVFSQALMQWTKPDSMSWSAPTFEFSTLRALYRSDCCFVKK